MRASLVRQRKRPLLGEDQHEASDAEMLDLGFKYICDLPGGHELFHAAPDAPLYGESNRILQGATESWGWDVVQRVLAAVANRIYETVYEIEDENGEIVRGRCKQKDVPPGATIIEDNLPPHFWFGDEVNE